MHALVSPSRLHFLSVFLSCVSVDQTLSPRLKTCSVACTAATSTAPSSSARRAAMCHGIISSCTETEREREREREGVTRKRGRERERERNTNKVNINKGERCRAAEKDDECTKVIHGTATCCEQRTRRSAETVTLTQTGPGSRPQRRPARAACMAAAAIMAAPADRPGPPPWAPAAAHQPPKPRRLQV